MKVARKQNVGKSATPRKVPGSTCASEDHVRLLTLLWRKPWGAGSPYACGIHSLHTVSYAVLAGHRGYSKLGWQIPALTEPAV